MSMWAGGANCCMHRRSKFLVPVLITTEAFDRWVDKLLECFSARDKALNRHSTDQICIQLSPQVGSRAYQQAIRVVLDCSLFYYFCYIFIQHPLYEVVFSTISHLPSVQFLLEDESKGGGGGGGGVWCSLSSSPPLRCSLMSSLFHPPISGTKWFVMLTSPARCSYALASQYSGKRVAFRWLCLPAFHSWLTSRITDNGGKKW